MAPAAIRFRHALVVLAAVAVAGCGGGTKTVTVRTQTETVTTTGRTTTTTTTEPPVAGQPSAAVADRYARRTYVVQPQLGRRVFKVAGPGATVTAADGSPITAFDMVLADSGDGTGQAVLLFRGTKFLGWASDRLAIRLAVDSSGDAIAVKYGNFQGDDPFCCPSSHTTVLYRWNGSRVVADGDPPLAYGKRGDQLHLGP
jgi:LppP/LprE lipoprotein